MISMFSRREKSKEKKAAKAKTIAAPAAGSTRVTDLGLKRAMRRRANRKKRWIRIGIAALVAAVIGFAVWVVFYSSWLVVKHIEVTGVNLVEPSRVSAAAESQIGKPLARVDADQIAAGVKELIEVESVEVSRSFPSTIRIKVTERSAVYQVDSTKLYSWVDKDGVVFHTQSTATEGLIEVKDTSEDEQVRKDLVTVIQAIPESWKGLVASITTDSKDGIVLTLTDKRTVVWGDASQSELKGEVVTALLNVKAKRYDVSSPANPTSK